jgi:hypothetical protein
MIVFDMLETRDGTWVPILHRQMVRHDGRLGLHMTLQHTVDAIQMRDTGEMVWVKRKTSSSGGPPIEDENPTEEE